MSNLRRVAQAILTTLIASAKGEPFEKWKDDLFLFLSENLVFDQIKGPGEKAATVALWEFHKTLNEGLDEEFIAKATANCFLRLNKGYKKKLSVRKAYYGSPKATFSPEIGFIFSEKVTENMITSKESAFSYDNWKPLFFRLNYMLLDDPRVKKIPMMFNLSAHVAQSPLNYDLDGQNIFSPGKARAYRYFGAGAKFGIHLGAPKFGIQFALGTGFRTSFGADYLYNPSEGIGATAKKTGSYKYNATRGFLEYYTAVHLKYFIITGRLFGSLPKKDNPGGVTYEQSSVELGVAIPIFRKYRWE